MIDSLAGLDAFTWLGRVIRRHGGERVEFNGDALAVQNMLRGKGIDCGALRPGRSYEHAITVGKGKADFARAMIRQDGGYTDDDTRD